MLARWLAAGQPRRKTENVTPALSLTDLAFRQALDDAFDRTGLALVFIRHNLGAREWWLVTTPAELQMALDRVGSNHGRSDAVEVYTPGDLAFTGDDRDFVKSEAVRILARTDVVLACRHEGNPELQDVLETDEVDMVDEWLADTHDGTLLVGPHPILTCELFYPDAANAFLAYGPLNDGTVLIGSY